MKENVLRKSEVPAQDRERAIAIGKTIADFDRVLAWPILEDEWVSPESYKDKYARKESQKVFENKLRTTWASIVLGDIQSAIDDFFDEKEAEKMMKKVNSLLKEYKDPENVMSQDEQEDVKAYKLANRKKMVAKVEALAKEVIDDLMVQFEEQSAAA
ncbi:MAG TPA: hypothetical protein VMX18_02295 [Candidatus Bipolaricaulota bacterium]|nr:hypothetical protein [Candidatus Bipolaricaulota bacterium]